MPSACEALSSDVSKPTAKVWTTPISSEATKAPASEPMPPTTTTTKMIEPTAAAIAGSVTKVMPPITPARPASARAGAEHQHEDARHVVAERLDHLRMRERAWITRPMRVRVSSSQTASSISSATSIMKARVAGNCEQAT